MLSVLLHNICMQTTRLIIICTSSTICPYAITIAMSGGVWAPYKELAGTVNSAILGKEPDAYYTLDTILTKHKPDFISLLKNPVNLLMFIFTICIIYNSTMQPIHLRFQHTIFLAYCSCRTDHLMHQFISIQVHAVQIS